MTKHALREAYGALLASGALRGQMKQQMALSAMIEYGPGTTGEIIALGHLGANVNGWRARFTELMARGLIRKVGQRKCKVSGFTSMVWEATGRTVPLDPNKGHVSRGPRAWRRLAEEAAQLLYEIAELKGQNPANTASLKARRGRALAEYRRLGGTVREP